MVTDRLRKAIEEAAAVTREADRDDPPAPGDLYVFPSGGDVGLEWLVVGCHPDDRSLLLLAPADDCPLAGTTDVMLPRSSVGRRLTVRCGQADWFTAGLCTPQFRVGTVPAAAVGLVRGRLAALARGLAGAEGKDDLDPEYEEWLRAVAVTRAELLKADRRDAHDRTGMA